MANQWGKTQLKDLSGSHIEIAPSLSYTSNISVMCGAENGNVNCGMYTNPPRATGQSMKSGVTNFNVFYWILCI